VYKNKKIILFSFASLDLARSADRLMAQANSSNYYDEVKILSPKDFDESMKKKFTEIIYNRQYRGYGYWFWKPFFLKKIMNEINTNDIINYVDIGCHLQNRNSRFNEYLDLLVDTDKWILPFQYYYKKEDFDEGISFPDREEFKYTKGDLLNYFGFLNNKDVTHTPQFWAGSFFIRKNIKSINFLEEWISFFEKRFDLIDDTVSKIKNFDGFIENRHDQSIFSLLCKKYDIKPLSAYNECEWGEKNNKRTWEHNENNPILAKRDLKYSIFKRFIMRQKKNFNRLLRKISK
tara:strand:+ start:576 stop:1445 length:870 start_codon:yes stop_codon:yes gene_type:complete